MHHRIITACGPMDYLGSSCWTLRVSAATVMPRDYLPDVWRLGGQGPGARGSRAKGGDSIAQEQKRGLQQVASLPGGTARRFVRLLLQVASRGNGMRNGPTSPASTPVETRLTRRRRRPVAPSGKHSVSLIRSIRPPCPSNARKLPAQTIVGRENGGQDEGMPAPKGCSRRWPGRPTGLQ